MKRLRYDFGRCRRLLLVDANNQKSWIGSRVEPEMHIPPIGLMSLAAFVRRKLPRVEIRLLETSLDAPDDGAYRRKLDEFGPDLVGIRGINVFLDEYRRAARLAKEWGDIPVIGGGPIATSMRKALLREIPAFDLLVKEEGELTLAELLAGGNLEDIPGIIYRDSEGIVENEDRPLIGDLNELPRADYSLIDIDKYRKHLSYTYNHRRQGVLSTSRGCPFRCTYCFTFGGKTARLRSARNVALEMDALWHEHGIEDFYFINDIFNLNRQRTRDIFSWIIENKRRWRLYFVNGLRTDVMEKDIVDLMVRAGTAWVTYAIETASPLLQRLTKRNMNLDKAAEIISYTQEKGIVVNVNTMYGFPTETPEMAQETLDWLARLPHPSVLPYHFCLRGYEGCDIVDQAEKAGWDRSLFLADNTLPYNALPRGTPTFPRDKMQEHVLRFHERLGMRNGGHLRHCVDLLLKNGYTEADVLDMYSVLQNRPLRRIPDIFSVIRERAPS